MDKFIPYHHIDGRAKALKLLEKHPLLPDVPWHAYRKIDGSNFSVSVLKAEDDLVVRFARRNGWLEPAERFQNSHLVCDDIRAKALKLAELLKDFMPHWQRIDVFGELYGTVDCKLRTTPGLTRIQGRIFYGPGVYFSVYDIRIDGEYKSKTLVDRFGTAAGFDVLEPLATGPLSDLLEQVGTVDAPGLWYPGKLMSTICERHGCEPLEGNMEEGVVLVAAQPIFLGPDKVRAIMKITHESEHLYRAAPEKQTKTKKPIGNDVAALPLHIQPWFFFLDSMIDDDRYASATSKLGACKPERIAGEMTADILAMAYERGELEEFMQTQTTPSPREEYEKSAKPIKPLLYKRCLALAKENSHRENQGTQ